MFLGPLEIRDLITATNNYAERASGNSPNYDDHKKKMAVATNSYIAEIRSVKKPTEISTKK
jgi:hypothetical protein